MAVDHCSEYGRIGDKLKLHAKPLVTKEIAILVEKLLYDIPHTLYHNAQKQYPFCRLWRLYYRSTGVTV